MDQKAEPVIQNSLLDYFMVVEFDPTQKTKTNLRSHYPDKFLDKTIPDTVPRFCFPEEELTFDGYDENREKIVEEFSFILTVMDGSRRFGFCRRYRSRKGDVKPFCNVIISNWSSFSLFQQVMDVIDLLPSEEVIVSFLKLLLSKPFPAKEETVAVELNVNNEKSNTFRFTRSSNPYEFLDYVSYEPLFKTCSVKTIMLLFSALLSESHVIGIGKTLPHISACMNALTSLIYPFNWQHVFIPILPKQLIEFVEAPMPFLIGMLSDAGPLLEEREIEEGTLILNFDNDTFIKAPAVIEETLPSTLATSLKRNLTRLKTSEIRGQAFNQLVAHIFLRFWVDIFVNYRTCFGTPQGEHNFDVQKFIKSRPKQMLSFLQKFERTQMFFMFIEEQEQLSAASKLNQCILVQETQASIRKKLEILKPKRGPKLSFTPDLAASSTSGKSSKQKRQHSDKGKTKKTKQKEPTSTTIRVSGKFIVQPTNEDPEEPTSKTRTYIGIGTDKDGRILRAFKEAQATFRSLEHAEFVTYYPLLRIRFPDIDKYIDTPDVINLLPLESKPLAAFLHFIASDLVDLVGLSFEELLDLLHFCGEGVPRLRLECANQIRLGLSEKVCVEHLRHAVELKSPSKDIKRLVEEMKGFFVAHWAPLVFEPSLLELPTGVLVDLMRLAGQASASSGFSGPAAAAKGPAKGDEAEVRRDTLREGLLKLFNNHVAPDYLLTVGDKEIPIHRYVLFANAPGNRLPLAGPTEEDEIDFTPDFNSFLILLKWAYVLEFNEEAALPLDDAQLLWETASNFLDDKAAFEDALCSWMVSGLSPKSVLKVIMQMEDKPYADVLREAVLDYVACNMAVLAKQAQLQQLPKPLLISIIQKLN